MKAILFNYIILPCFKLNFEFIFLIYIAISSYDKINYKCIYLKNLNRSVIRTYY